MIFLGHKSKMLGRYNCPDIIRKAAVCFISIIIIWIKRLIPFDVNVMAYVRLCLSRCFAFPHFVGKYESHTRVHTGEKPFQCDICLQCYSTKSNLTVHKKKHDSDTPVQRKEHKCPFCNKLHASRKTLSRHVKRWVGIPSQS